jgi:Xaa-Pro dipeptidase
LLLDVWGKKNTPAAVYYDITWMGFRRRCSVRAHACKFFEIVRDARDAGVKTAIDAVNCRTPHRRLGSRPGHPRGYIQEKGYGEYFIHRTGHSIGTDVHANGANMDDLEIHDERQLLPNSCFSIEPGIYLPEFGVRSEVNVLVRAKSAEVTGKIQREIVTI